MVHRLQSYQNEPRNDFSNAEKSAEAICELLAEFTVSEQDGFDRANELICVGLPIPNLAVVTEPPLLSSYFLRDPDGNETPVEARELELWPSGTAKWLEIVAPVSIEGNLSRKLQLRRKRFVVSSNNSAEAHAGTRPNFALRIAPNKNGLQLLCNKDAHTLEFDLLLRKGGPSAQIKWGDVEIVSDSRLCNRFRLKGTFGGPKRCEITLDMFFNRMTSELRLSIVLHNPRAATHRNGFWDLGDKNSELIRSFALVQRLNEQATACDWRIDAHTDALTQDLTTLSALRQYTSGSDCVDSKVHLRADGTLPKEVQRGFEFFNQESKISGRRASPTITIRAAAGQIMQSTMNEFWQKFPSEVVVDGNQVRWGIFPLSDALYELQPGEKTSRTFAFSIFSPVELRHLGRPICIHLDRSSIKYSRALDWPSEYSEGESEYANYAKHLLVGPNSFEAKREIIDEFGWRNYGDVWADHEEPFALEPRPVISHYNNQYDLLNGLLRAYIASGDVRWRNLAFPLANHVLDIDLYDTGEDRPVFNGGLFWHTAHYLHAGTSSHRSQSIQMSFATKHRVNGTGPGSNEHNYTTGLKSYYELTGDVRAKSAVLRMAHWVLALDDGSRTVLAPFSGLPTGRASSTASASYHGPGRGVGNSINCLLDAWQLSGDKTFLEKCDLLILRVVHPLDDVAKLNLLDAEMRWSYTVCLQSLVKYLVLRADVADYMFRYVLSVLRQYGRWMASYEDSYFARVNELEFPTETWHAQDLRKANILQLIAGLLLKPADKLAAQITAKKIHDVAWKGLRDSETRYFTRPAAIVLQQWPIYEFLQSDSLNQLFELSANIPDSDDFGSPLEFVSQHTHVAQSIRNLGRAAKMIRRSLWVPHWKPVLKHLQIKIKQL